MSLLGAHDDRHRVDRLVAAGVGVLLVLFGADAVRVGLGHAFAGPQGGLVVGQFGADVLSGVVHLLLAAVLLVAGVRGTGAARAADRLVGAVCFVLAVLGLVTRGTGFDLLAARSKTGDLHLVLALLLVGVGVVADRAPTSGHGPRYRTVRPVSARGGRHEH